MKITMYTDGGCRGNPGPSSAGVYFPGLGAKSGTFLGTKTNNEAEYLALLDGLQTCSDLGATSVEIFADSKLMVNQVNSAWQCKNESLYEIRDQVWSLLHRFDEWSINHVPRELNSEADAICNRVLDDPLHSSLREGFEGI